MHVCKIITFYSFKGGVGRSMALANVAVALAACQKRVCVIDWDLEAPGVENYFSRLSISPAIRDGGLLHILEGKVLEWDDLVNKVRVFGREFSLITAGQTSHAYTKRLQAFAWEAYYEQGGGEFIEVFGSMLRTKFDYVLIDSRTGLTDASGVCTIQLPDILVLMFTVLRGISWQSIELTGFSR